METVLKEKKQNIHMQNHIANNIFSRYAQNLKVQEGYISLHRYTALPQ